MNLRANLKILNLKRNSRRDFSRKKTNIEKIGKASALKEFCLKYFGLFVPNVQVDTKLIILQKLYTWLRIVNECLAN